MKLVAYRKMKIWVVELLISISAGIEDAIIFNSAFLHFLEVYVPFQTFNSLGTIYAFMIISTFHVLILYLRKVKFTFPSGIHVDLLCSLLFLFSGSCAIWTIWVLLVTHTEISRPWNGEVFQLAAFTSLSLSLFIL